MQCACAPYCDLWSVRLYSICQPYLLNGAICGGKKLLTTNCVFQFFLQRLYDTFSTLSRTQRHITTVFTQCAAPIPTKHEFFPDRFSKNALVPNFMKIRPVGTELFHEDGWTDMKKSVEVSSQLPPPPTSYGALPN
jgi:hypothetical protein